MSVQLLPTIHDPYCCSFELMQKVDLKIMQKRLSNLKFLYTIPASHLSFAVPNSSYKFVFMASYSQFVTHDAQIYTQFIANYVIPVPTVAQPQPAALAQPRIPPSTPVNSYVASSVEPLLQSSRAHLSSHRSRLSISNIQTLQTTVSAAVSSNTELTNLSANPDILVNRLLSHSQWTNRDIGLLLLSIHGVIPLELPTVSSDQQDHVIDNSEEQEISEQED